MISSRSRLALIACVAVTAVVVVTPSHATAAPGKCETVIFLDQACELGKTVLGKAASVATAPIRHAAGSVMDTITSWVADSTQWVLAKVVNFIDDSTSPDLGLAWFKERYRFMVGVGALVMLPILLLAAIKALFAHDLSQLLRAAFVFLPTAILGSFVAAYLTQSLLIVTDEMSAAVSAGIAEDTSQIFDSVGKTLSGSVGTASPGIPSFAIFLVAFVVIIGAFFVWLELLVRSAAVTVAVFFMPLILAGLVWPGGARWTKRMIETLFALIVSKFVIVGVISLATAALADPGGGGFGTVVGAAALMLMAAFAPFAILKLMPMVESSAANGLEGMRYRHQSQLYHHTTGSYILAIMHSRMRSSGARAAAAPAGAAPAAAVAASAAAMGMAAAGTATRAGVSGGQRGGQRGGSARRPASADESPDASAPVPPAPRVPRKPTEK